MLCGMWDLSSPARDQTHASCRGIEEPKPLGCQGILRVFRLAQLHTSNLVWTGKILDKKPKDSVQRCLCHTPSLRDMT